MTTERRTINAAFTAAAALGVLAGMAWSQEGQIIDGSAIGTLVYLPPPPPGCLPRFMTATLWLANDDPDDEDDTLYEISAIDGSVLRTIPAPDAHPQGVMAGLLSGDPLAVTVYVVNDDPGDDSLDTVYEISSFDGSIVNSFPATGLTDLLSPRSLVQSLSSYTITAPPACISTGDELVISAWIANGDTLCLIDLETGATIRSIPAPCGSPQGLEMGINPFTTMTLFVACDDDDMIYLVDTSDGSVLTSFASPAPNPSGLAMALVLPETSGQVVSPLLPLTLWQGENVADTMDNQFAAGGLIDRLEPECDGTADMLLWDNEPDGPDDALWSSQLETVYPFESQVADDFRLVEDARVLRVEWNGGFWNGSPITVPEWNIFFYADAGGVPEGGPDDPSDLALASFVVPDEDMFIVPEDDGTFTYSTRLEGEGFLALADEPYWIAIQAVHTYPPQWGISGSLSSQQLEPAHQGFPLLDIDYWTLLDPVTDAAFRLYGELDDDGCIGDLDGDGDTDQSDLGELLASYQMDGGGDLDGDGDTDQSDLGILLSDYPCP